VVADDLAGDKVCLVSGAGAQTWTRPISGENVGLDSKPGRRVFSYVIASESKKLSSLSKDVPSLASKLGIPFKALDNTNEQSQTFGNENKRE
jgi:hypothetical protein